MQSSESVTYPISSIASFVLVTEAFDDNLAEEGYLEDSQMAICAYGVLQKLHTFKTNSFIEVIEDEVERFII